MLARLDNYRLGHRIVSFSKSRDASRRLAEDGLEHVALLDDALEHRPSGCQLEAHGESLSALSSCAEFDVLEISGDGKVFRCFSDEADDNAIAITGRCNSSCIMCPDSDKARSQASTRDIETLLKLVRHIPSDARHLTITGGEPFLLGEDIFRLFEAMTAKFLRTDFLLLTNGRVLSVGKYCRELKRTLPSKALIGIPLHGFDARTHDGITQAPGSFKQTVAGIENLIRLNMRVELRVVVSKVSADNLDQIAELIATRLDGVECVKIIGLEMLGSAAKNRDEIWLPYPKAFAKSRSAITQLVAHGIDVGIYNFPLCAVDREFWPICERSISGYKVCYADQCGSCGVQDACGGLFFGSRRFAEPDIRAMEGEPL